MSRRNPYPRPLTGTERVYEIHEVARLTGLAPARLRAWERRYAVVRPERQANGYRAYTAEQVALLRAYAKLIGAGERVGNLAERPLGEVLSWAEEREVDGTAHGALLDAIIALDRDRLETLVAQQLGLRGVRNFSRDVVIPLAQEVGDLWALGKLPVAAEHLASEVVVHALKGGLRLARGNGPVCVAACLPGERHEWGFLASLTEVQELGWQVHYLGPDLPVDDIVEAAWRRHAQAVALSSSDPALVEDQLPALSQVVGKLPPRTFAVIGGSGTEPFARILRSHGFRIGLDPFSLDSTGLAGQVAAG